MINVENSDNNKRELIIQYETGEDWAFLTSILQLIAMRNLDKEQIIGLKEELI